MKRWKEILGTIGFLLVLNCQVCATTVAVYAESGLIEDSNQMLVKIYADIADTTTDGPLVSAGVKLNYDGPLSNPVADKNDNDWYMGTPQNKYAYMNPTTSTNGEVVLLVGKLDQNAPLEGVSGQRILLGSVTFDYTGDAPTAANLTLGDGHGGSFVDFATTEGIDLDSNVTYTINQVVSNDTLILKDVIRILQLTCGMTPDQPIRATVSDRNGDQKIGLDEVLHLLNQMSL